MDERNRVELSYGFDQYDKSDYLLFNSTDVRDYSNVQHTVRGIYTYDLTADGRSTMIVGGDYMRDYLMSYQFEEGGYYIQHTADVFAQVETNINEHWNLIGGMRYDFFSQKRLSHFSPKLSVMYRTGRHALRLLLPEAAQPFLPQAQRDVPHRRMVIPRFLFRRLPGPDP